MKTFDKLKTDIESIKGLVDKYKPVVQDKIKEYKPIIKKDAMKMKNQFEKEVLPGLKSMGQQFKDSFEKSGMNSKKFKDSIKNVCKNYNKSVDVMVDYEHPSNPSTEWFYENLREKNDKEFLLGRTLTGPHLDKHTPYFNSKNLKMFGSQGEHKLAFVVIKIAEHYFIEKETGKKPTLLLDDLFSKLDLERGNAIFDLIKTSGQAFITNTDLVTAEQHGIDTKDTNNKTIHLVRNWKN